MYTIYQLKPLFQKLLRPIVQHSAKIGITPNQVTIGALILSIATGLAIYLSEFAQWSLISLPVVLFLRMALNAIDGMLAREHNMKTPIGAILNEVSDVVSDTALYLPFAFMQNTSSILVILFVVTSIIGELTGTVGVQVGGFRRNDGPMGKSDRAFVFGIIGILLGFGLKAGLWFDFVMAVLVALTFVTIFNRGRNALKEVNT